MKSHALIFILEWTCFLCLLQNAKLYGETWAVDELYLSGHSTQTHDRLLSTISEHLENKTLTLRIDQRSESFQDLLPGQWLRYEFRGNSVFVYAEHTLGIYQQGYVSTIFFQGPQKTLTCEIFLSGQQTGETEKLQLQFQDKISGTFFIRTYPAISGPREILGSFVLN